MNNILNFTSESELSLKAALCVLSYIKEALEKQNFCSIILGGGNTPRNCYKHLARLLMEHRIPPDGLYWFFGDERWVSPDDPESNENMARHLLLRPAEARPEHIFSWRATHESPATCAAKYHMLIHDFFIAGNRSPDICMLGMGSDGHTASLFPRSTILAENARTFHIKKDMKKYAIAVILPDGKTRRLSLTPHILNKAKHILFLIQGEHKSRAFLRLQSGDSQLPAAWIKGKDQLFFITNDVLGPA
ncbi:MAG: 6-phosphogluconolactonase [Spirochaetales bacterium]|nr:6-phosphogluconolactonase [Spirochaetales bacterium]